MNKEKAVLRINKIGKIGKIVAIVLMVFIFFIFSATVAGGIFLNAVPDDFLVMNISNNAEFILDATAIGQTFDDSTKEALEKAINQQQVEAGVNLGAVSFPVHSGTVSDNKVILDSSVNGISFSISSISGVLLAAAVSLTLAFISILFGAFLCNAFAKCTSPFDSNVILKMRNFAFALIPWALLSDLPRALAGKLSFQTVKINLGPN